MGEVSTFVGLDVHKDLIAVAVAAAGGGPPRSLGTIPNEPAAIGKLLRKVGRPGELLVCYEAGPCGYTIYRQLRALGITGVVVAPSLVPKKPGDRVKTDRRDALKLARLLRSGDLDPVWVPDEAHEALRDLSRAREDAQQELHRVRQRVSKLLLRLGVAPPPGVRAWTVRYRTWLDRLVLPHHAQQVVLRESLVAIDQAQARREHLEAELVEAAAASPLAPVLAALQSLRGVAFLTAVTLVAELGDLTRFGSARELMGYTGVVPSEYSTGGKANRGPITKTGNAHVRHAVVEAAWHYRQPPRIGKALQRRQAGQPAAVTAQAWKAQQRLHRRYQRLLKRGKLKQQAVVAVARELLGFIWGIAQLVAVAGPTTPPLPARSAA